MLALYLHCKNLEKINRKKNRHSRTDMQEDIDKNVTGDHEK